MRSTVANAAVMRRRDADRSSRVPGARFDPTTTAGRDGSIERNERPFEEVEVVVVDVEDHDLGAPCGEDPRAQRLAVVGTRQHAHRHVVVARCEVVRQRTGAVGRSVLDDDDLERCFPSSKTGHDLAERHA